MALDESGSPLVADRQRGWLASRLCLFVACSLVLDMAFGQALKVAHSRVVTGQVAGGVNAAIAARADVLIVGPSTALHHYDDGMLEHMLGTSVWNAGAEGRGLLYGRGLLSLVAAIHPPKVVVFDVSYFENEREASRALAPFYGRNATVDRILTLDWRERIKLLSRTYRFNGMALSIVSNWGRPARLHGFEPVGGALTERPAAAPRGDKGFGGWFAEEIRGFVGDARAAGSAVVFVESPSLSPLNPEVLEAYAKIGHETGVPFVRIELAAVPEFADIRLFRDAIHLNAEGAAKFTAIVGTQLQRLGFGRDSR